MNPTSSTPESSDVPADLPGAVTAEPFDAIDAILDDLRTRYD